MDGGEQVSSKIDLTQMAPKRRRMMDMVLFLGGLREEAAIPLSKVNEELNNLKNELDPLIEDILSFPESYLSEFLEVFKRTGLMDSITDKGIISEAISSLESATSSTSSESVAELSELLKARYEKLESKLEKYNGNLVSATVDLAKDWRSDRVLRRLDAMLVVVDEENSYMLSGNGDVISSDDGIMAIGSGGNFALSAARALIRHSPLSASDIVRESLKIASETCIYTNDQIVVEELRPAK